MRQLISIILAIIFVFATLAMIFHCIGWSSGGFYSNYIQNNNYGFLVVSFLISFFSAIGYKKTTHKNIFLKILIIIFIVMIGYLILGGIFHSVGFCPEYFDFMPRIILIDSEIPKNPVSVIEIIQKIFCPFSGQTS
jgi:hypothetical protein